MPETGTADQETEAPRYGIDPRAATRGGEEAIYPFYLYLGGGNTLPHFTVHTGINSTFALTTSLSKIVFLHQSTYNHTFENATSIYKR
jgi:hypothetical protein